MKTLCLVALVVVTVYSFPADKNVIQLKELVDTLDKLISKVGEDPFVVHLKEKEEHGAKCEVKTFCKAQKILSKHIKESKAHEHKDKLSLHLDSYTNKDKKICETVRLEEDAEEYRLKDFLKDLRNCATSELGSL